MMGQGSVKATPTGRSRIITASPRSGTGRITQSRGAAENRSEFERSLPLRASATLRDAPPASHLRLTASPDSLYVLPVGVLAQAVRESHPPAAETSQ